MITVDIETWSDFDINSQDYVRTAEIRFCGIHDVKTDEYFLLPYTEKERAKKIIKERGDIIITHNGEAFDIPILKNNGYITGNNFTSVDTLIVLKKHNSMMKHPLTRFSMKNAGKELLGLEKGDMDYTVFKKTNWTPEEILDIRKYLKQDLNITSRLFKYCEEELSPLKAYLNDYDKKRLKHLTLSPASYVYSVICKELGIKKEFEDGVQHKKYKGGYVAPPMGETFTGKIYCIDYNSLYPHNYIQGNLFSNKCFCCNEETKWQANEFFPELKGKYCSKHMGDIEKLISRFYKQRVKFKKVGDPRQYALKIIINCFSDDTQILTENGVKLIQDCKIGEMAYSINPKNGNVELKPIIDKIKMNYKGDMYHFKSDRYDMMVTPNHKMLLQKKRKDGSFEPLQFEEAQNINTQSRVFPKFKEMKSGDKYIIDFFDFKKKSDKIKIKLKKPYSQRKNLNLKYDGNDRTHAVLNGETYNLQGEWFIQGGKRDMKILRYPNVKDLFYLIGIFISEGYLYINKEKKYTNGNYRGKSYRINISQYKKVNPETYNKIKNVLESLKFRYNMTKKNFCISSKFLYDFLSIFKTDSENISIPNWVFEYKNIYLKKLFEGLYDGDGTKKQNVYTTKSKDLRDSFIKLITHLGYKWVFKFENNTTGGVWKIYFQKHKKRNWLKSRNTKIVDYNGKITCVTVADNHTILVGRNGKFHFSGQTIYGVCGNPTFKNLYDPVTAADCTYMARKIIQFSRDKFIEKGYTFIYTDTDSVFLLDPFENEELLIKTKNDIINKIKTYLPFPQDTFDMGIDDRIKAMFFIKSGDKYLKKNYMYITEDNKLKVKGLKIVKSNASKIAKIIYKKYLTPAILEKLDIKFSPLDIRKWVMEELHEDYKIAGFDMKVNNPDSYKMEGQLQRQVALKYGVGVHFMIPTNRYGVGKGVKICTLEDFNTQGLTIDDINLKHVYSELSPFMIGSLASGIIKKNYKGKEILQNTLELWV